MNRFRNLTAIALVAALLSIAPWAGFCFGIDSTEEEIEAITSELPDESCESKVPLDNDALFEEYINSLFGLDGSGKAPAKNRNQLTGINRAIYDKLKPEIHKVANGSSSSTVFEVPLENLNLEKNGWTASELGVASIIEGDDISQEAVNAMWQMLGLDINAIVNTLLADCPYELYWYDKVTGATMDGGYVEATGRGEEVTLSLASGFSFSFSVAQGYAAGQYEVDTTNIDRVNHAVDKAAAIVDSAKTKADREKLDSYREEICSLVEYDHSAADDSSTPYGDPWQIVSVFDEDNSTNVVCEGYSKAFQYLCKLTEFEGDISCISVTGTMKGGTGEGPHMWNIVNMEDGMNYLADVTNCDEGSIGAPDKLFLTGSAGGDYEKGYTFGISGEIVNYVYDSNTTNVYSSEELELAQGDTPESGTCGCDAYWSIDESGKLTISGKGEISDAPWKDYYISELTEVIIGDGITGLVADAFGDCTSLSKATLPEGLIRIGDFAFYNTGLTEVDLPDSVERIGAYSFSDCKQLASVTLSSNLQQIDFSAFCRDTALTEISIPDGAYVDNYAFDGCSNLRSAYVGGDLGEGVFRECTSLRSATIGPRVQSLGKFAFVNCENLESVVLPDSITALSESVFSYCTSLTTINIPKNLKEIPLQAFSFCTSLKNVTFGGKVTSIGEGAFSDCSSLENIDLPEGVKNIENYAFASCEALKNISLPEGLEKIGDRAFSTCHSLISVSIPSTVTTIGKDVWLFTSELREITVDADNQYYCAIDGILYSKDASELLLAPKKISGEIEIPGTVDTISEHAFSYCNSLKRVTVKEGVKHIGKGAFASCYELEEVLLPDSIESIDEAAFNNCLLLKGVVLPANLTEISNSLFSFCRNITYIYIPERVESVGTSAFKECTKLEDLDIDPNNPYLAFENGILYNAAKTEVLECICNDESNLIIPEGIKRIREASFMGWDNIAELTLPDSLETIERDAFCSCTNIQKIHFGNKLKTLGNSAFADCSKLTSINLPAGLQTIKGYAFGNCCLLQAINIPESVKTIEGAAFSECEKLSEVNGCSGLNEVGEDVFRNTAFINDSGNWEGTAIYLAHVLLKAKEDIDGEYHVKEGTTVLAGAAFENCTELDKVIINKGLKTIGDRCFSGCWNLAEVRLPAGVKKIGEAAFYKFAGRPSGSYETVWFNINIPGSVEYIGKNCFDGFTNVRFEGNPPASYVDAFTGYGWLTFYYPASIAEWQEVVENNQIDFQGNEITWESYAPDHIHDYTVAAEEEPSCTEEGWIKYTCDCGETYTDTVDALGHDWGEWVITKNPSSTEYGEQQRTCSRCGDVDIEAVPKQAPPEIITQPEAVKAEPGAKATIKIVAKGRELKYQWQWKSGSKAWTNTTLSGYNTNTLSFTAQTAHDGRQYRCVVTDIYGNTVVSDAAKLTVRTDLEITAQPKAVKTAPGYKVTFNIKAKGDGLKYQWQWKSGIRAWANTTLSGYNTDTLSFKAQEAHNGRKYRCVVTDAYGNTLESEGAELTVKDGPVVTTQPEDISVTAGSKAIFKVNATGNGLKYQWQWKSGIRAWANTTLSGCNTDTLSFTVQEAHNGRQYRCVVTDAKGNVTESDGAKLTVKEGPAIISQPSDVTATTGSKVSFKVEATGKGLKYQWQWKSGTRSWASTTLSGYNTDTLSFKVQAAHNGRQYRCVITDANGNSAETFGAKLTVKEGPAITSQPADVTSTVGSKVTFKVAATGDGLKYQWQWKSGSRSWANTTLSGYNTNTLSFTAQAAHNGRQYRCVITDANGKTAESEGAKLTVKEGPTITKQPGDVTAAVGSKATFKVTASGTGLKYQWQWKSGSRDWANTTLSGYNTDTLSFTASEAHNGRQYRCVVTDANGNTVESEGAKLTVTAE